MTILTYIQWILTNVVSNSKFFGDGIWLTSIFHRKLDAFYEVSNLFYLSFNYILSGPYSHSCDPNTRVYPVYYDTVPEVSVT
jgi:hypothetical protein